MKLLIIVFTFCMSFFVYGKSTPNDCFDHSDMMIQNEELLKLSCISSDISAAILEDKSIVPSTLYHYGNKEHLKANITEGNVPQKAWDNFVMGESTSFGLRKSRRGLYGTSGIDTNFFFSAKSNWLMQISIKEECRSPERVVDISRLDRDPRFIEWYNKNAADFKKSPSIQWYKQDEWFAANKDKGFDWFKANEENGTYAAYKGKFDVKDFYRFCRTNDYVGFVEKECEELVDNFLVDKKFAVVHDHIISKSFYIRDRDCVDNLRGTSDDWLTILSRQSNLWVSRCGEVSIKTLPGLLLQSLASSDKKILNDDANKLIENISTLTNYPDSFKKSLAQVIKAKQRCDSVGKKDLSNFLSSKMPQDLNVWKNQYPERPINFEEELKNLFIMKESNKISQLCIK